MEETALAPLESISFVESFFSNKLNEYVLFDKGRYAGFWWVVFYNYRIDIKIRFAGEGAYFYIKIHIEDTEYDLWRFDRSVNDKSKSTRKNILYQLEILSLFLSGL